MNQKNLLFICNYAATYAGNFIASLSLLARKAREAGMEVYFLFPEETKPYSWKRILSEDENRFFYWDGSVKATAVCCRQLRKQLGDRQTIVHTHFLADWHLLAVRLAFSNVVCHYHMTVPPCYNVMKQIKRLVRQVIYRNLVLVGVSQAVTADMKQYFRSPHCECIPNAIDFEALEQCAEGTDLSREFQGPDGFRILMHGTDFYRKAVDLAVRAVDSLNEQEPGAFSLYVTSHQAEEARAIVESLSPGMPHVRVVRPVANIKRVYESMDLFISPSRQEAFGYAVVEAAAANCQVAASDVPGQDTMHCIPGILWFAVNDLAALKAAILKAREHQRSGAAAAIKQTQRSQAMALFSIEEWVQQNLAVYKKYFGQ